MTETEKARLAEAQKFIDENTFPRNPRGCNSTVELLASYGAAQYEAGAADMRERAAGRAYIGASRSITREIRALPLREKD